MRGPRSNRLGLGVLTAAALMLVGCPSDDEPAAPTTEPQPTDASPDDTTTSDADTEETPSEPVRTGGSIKEIAAACADGAGAVLVDSDVQASSTSVELPDCEIRLEPGVGMDLVALSITGGQLVITDSAGSTGTNLLNFERLSVDVESFVIELVDPDDAFRAQNLSLTTDAGIDMRVGDLDDGDGGTIHLIETSLASTAPDSTVQLTTSDGSGTLLLERTSIDTPGDPRLSGAECVAEVNDQQMECAP